MSKVLIIGGAGFIGSKLCHRLRTQGDEVVALDNFMQYSDPLQVNYSNALTYRKALLENVTIIRGDATVTMDMQRCLKNVQPDVIVHLAALTRADINDDNMQNALLSSQAPIMNIVEYYRNCPQKLKRLIYISSSYVYGNFTKDYCLETDAVLPTSTYGAVKSSCEILVQSWGKRFDLPYTIIRPIAVYGPSDLNGKLSMQNIARALREKELVVMGSLDELSDYTYIDDLVEGISMAIHSSNANNEIFNISSGAGVKLSEIIACFNSLGYEVQPRIDGIRKSRPRRGYLSIEKAKKELGYQPKIALADGLKQCIEYIHGNNIFIG